MTLGTSGAQLNRVAESDGATDAFRRKNLPNLPLQIQEDLERFRKAQGQKAIHTKINSYLTTKSNRNLAEGNSVTASVMTTPEEQQISFSEIEEKHNSPLGQLQQLSINDPVNIGQAGGTGHQTFSVFFKGLCV